MERDGVGSLPGGPRRPGIAGALASRHPGRHGRGGQSRGTTRARGGGLVPPLRGDGLPAGTGMEAVRSRNECARTSEMVGLVCDGHCYYAGHNHAAVGMATLVGARCTCRMAEPKQECERKRGMTPWVVALACHLSHSTIVPVSELMM